MNRTIKLKGTNLFSKESWSVVRRAVPKVNSITMKASMLAKAYYLSQDEPIPLDESLYKTCFKVVTGSGLVHRGKMTPEKLAEKRIYEAANILFQRDFGAHVDISDMSLSHVLVYSAKDLETAQLNNIQFHFPKYLNLYMYKHLEGLFDKKTIAKARNHLLYDTECPTQLSDWIQEHRTMLIPERHEIFDLDILKRPWPYLHHMVWIVRHVEINFPGAKLLSPIVTRRSYVPKHIRLDTNGLVQLLMKKEDIKDFVAHYYLKYKMTPKLKNKSDLGQSFKSSFDREATDEREDFMYQQEFWNFLCRFDHPKYAKATYKGLSFGNSITTDGCSVSLLLVERLAKKEHKPRNVKKKKSGETQIECDENALFLGCDPGKRDLVAITDGSRSFRYTKGQRESDCQRKKYERRNTNARATLTLEGEFQSKKTIVPGYYAMIENPTLLQYESEILSKNSYKSCIFDNFASYVKAKVYSEDKVSKLYETPRFRNDRFTRYCLTKSSEDKMICKLKKFVESRETLEGKTLHDEIVRQNAEKTSYSNVNIFYGNWGRDPNLKAQAPTPGTGLRRKIDKTFKTITVAEHYTSKTCPRCKERTLEKAGLTGPTRVVARKHSLLCCSNCSSWWNRNVVGAYNILLKGLNEQAGTASA